MKTWKKTISLVTAAVFAIGTAWFPTGIENVNATEKESISADHAEGQVIVRYTDPEDVVMTEKQEETADEIQEESEELISIGDDTMALVESDTKSTEELIAEISSLPNVDYVEPNYIFKTAGSGQKKSSDRTGEQWAFNTAYGINVPDWNNAENRNAEGTVVAVIDSGVDYEHEDLENVMWDDGKKYKSLVELGGGKYGIDVVDEDDDPMAEYPHGTHCAGIIGAEWNGTGVSGGASGTEIMAIKSTFREEGESNDSLLLDDVITSFKYVIEAKKAGVNVVAINASWGAPGLNLTNNVKSIRDLVTCAGKQWNIVTVFASCNEGENCDKPASGGYYLTYFMKDVPYRLVVNSNTSEGKRASSSNYGPKTTDVFAPGDSILSTVLSDRYGTMSGTSMAAPAVSAAVAIVAAAKPEATAYQIVEIIKKSTTDVDALSKYCSTGGIVNVAKALEIPEDEIVQFTGISKLTGITKGFYVKVCKQKADQVNGYQVRYSTYSSMKGATVKTIGTKYNAVSKTIKKLKKKKKYYVQARAYKIVDGQKHYSVWSSSKTVKTK